MRLLVFFENHRDGSLPLDFFIKHRRFSTYCYSSSSTVAVASCINVTVIRTECQQQRGSLPEARLIATVSTAIKSNADVITPTTKLEVEEKLHAPAVAERDRGTAIGKRSHKSFDQVIAPRDTRSSATCVNPLPARIGLPDLSRRTRRPSSGRKRRLRMRPNSGNASKFHHRYSWQRRRSSLDSWRPTVRIYSTARKRVLRHYGGRRPSLPFACVYIKMVSCTHSSDRFEGPPGRSTRVSLRPQRPSASEHICHTHPITGTARSRPMT